MMTLLVDPIFYGLSALGFAFLLFLLIITHQHTLQKSLLIMAAFLTILWALDAACYTSLTTTATTATAYFASALLPLESLRNFSWYVLIASLLTEQKQTQTFIREVIHSRNGGFLSATLLILYGLELSNIAIPWLGYRYLILWHLIQSATGLWLIEQLYRRTAKPDRWTIKPLGLGLGMIFAYDFALYANSIITSRIDTVFFTARSLVIIVSVPLIAMTARRVKNWATRIYVSRSIVYGSTLLTMAGGYLLAMAGAGYYIRYIGGNWGNMLQNIFFALSGLILVGLFTSESLRRQVRVFITKHFYANKYEYREEWMKFASVLEEDAATPYAVALNALLRPFDCERGMLVTLEDGRLKKQAEYPGTIDTESEDEALKVVADAALTHHWIIDVEELRQSRGKTAHKRPPEIAPQVISSIHTFSHGIPIASHGGIPCVVFISHPQSTRTLNWEDRDLMFAISKQLSVYLRLYQTNQTLTENQQFATFNRMSAFLAHDLKNILAQLQLLSKNARQHRTNPEFIDDAFDTIDSAVTRLSKVVEHLKKQNVSNTHTQETFAIDTLVRQSCADRAATVPKPVYYADNPPAVALNTDKERFRNVLDHLIQNAQEATPADGMITITTGRANDCYIICIEANGSGMSKAFIEQRLFKPFDTTKGNSGMGIGAYDAKKFIEQLHGYIQVKSKQGQGSRFVIHIPLSECVAENVESRPRRETDTVN